MLKPVGYGVLIKPVEVENELKQDKDSRIVIPDSVKDAQRIETTIGLVIGIGDQAWVDQGNGTPWCKVGDKIMYARFGGKIFKHPETGEFFVLVQDRDILGIVED